jgi:nucleotide-binding universal stress UspA family protein
MSFKTILVHAGDKRHFENVLRPALYLARRFEGHLAALSILPPPIVQQQLTAFEGQTVVIREHRQLYINDADQMRARFEDAAREAGLEDRHEWITDDAGFWPIWRMVAEYARVADLTVVAQGEEEPAIAATGEGPEEIVLSAGRPILIVPSRGDHAEVGRRVLVAWNGGREAARAAFDALPLLKGADVVRILWVNPGDEEELAQDVPAADLATALARHKVRAEAAEVTRGDREVGQTLLDAAQEMGADLLVMGCYGHSRLREYVLGGATRVLLRRMTIPVLMSH